MPRRPRRKIKHKQSNLSIEQLAHLISGYALDGAKPIFGGVDKNGFPMPFYDDSHRRECWEKNRNHILSLAGRRVNDPLFFWARYDERGRRVYFRANDMPAAARDYDAKKNEKFD